MKGKIIFVVAATCLCQVFGQETLESTKLEKMDDFGLHFTFSGLSDTVAEDPIKTFICYEEGQPSYETAVKNFTDGVKEIGTELEEILKKSEDKPKDLMKELIANITQTSDLFLKNLESILLVEPKEAANKIKHSRLIIQVKDVALKESINTMKSKCPDACGIEKKYKEVRDKALEETKEVDEKFKQCYQKYKSIEDSDVDDLTQCS